MSSLIVTISFVDRYLWILKSTKLSIFNQWDINKKNKRYVLRYGIGPPSEYHKKKATNGQQTKGLSSWISSSSPRAMINFERIPMRSISFFLNWLSRHCYIFNWLFKVKFNYQPSFLVNKCEGIIFMNIQSTENCRRMIYNWGLITKDNFRSEAMTSVLAETFSSLSFDQLILFWVCWLL